MNDRGHKKWTALMLPEHKERIQRWVQSQHDVRMPVLDADQLQEINDLILTSLQEQRQVQVTYYREKRFANAWGWIKRCDPLDGYLLLEDENEGSLRIRLSVITEVHLQ